MTDAALTGIFTLAGSALAGGLAYLQSRTSRQAERLRARDATAARFRQERKDAYLRVLSTTAQAQDGFVKLQSDEHWASLPAAQRLADVRQIRHLSQEAVFSALLVVQADTEAMSVLADLNRYIFEAGDKLAEDPTAPPDVVDIGPVLMAFNRDLAG